MADNWQLKAILSASDKMSPVLKNVSRTARDTRKYLADVGSSSMKLAGQIGVPLGLLSGAAGALSVAGLQKIVTGFADATGNIADKSKGLTMTTAEYQRMGFIAKMSGMDVAEMGDSIGRLNKNIAMAAAGKNAELAGLLKRAGISMRDTNGQLRSGMDLLPEVADLFKRNGNAAVQARMGNAIYGKSWQTMAPALSGGGEEIKRLTDRYHELGVEIEGGAIEAGEAFGDQMDEARMVASSYGNIIASKLLPVLSPLLEKTIKWALANRELIATNVANFLSEMVDGLSKVDWSGMIKDVNDIVAGVKSFIEFVGGAKNALIALVVVMNAQAIVAAVGLGMSIFRLGMHITGLAGKALGTVAPLQVMTTGMKGAELRAASLSNSMGRLAAAGGLLTAATAGWQFGSWLYDEAIAGTKFGDKIGSGVAHTLAFFGNEDAKSALAANERDPLAGMQPPLAANERRPLAGPQSRGRVDGSIRIDVNGLPPGSRVEQVAAGGDMPIDLNMGISSAALGMP